jgi:hypothetical protein
LERTGTNSDTHPYSNNEINNPKTKTELDEHAAILKAKLVKGKAQRTGNREDKGLTQESISLKANISTQPDSAQILIKWKQQAEIFGELVPDLTYSFESLEQDSELESPSAIQKHIH